MQQHAEKTSQGPAAADQPEVPFGSNEVRLSPRQWLVVLVILSALFYLIPVAWERIEPLETGADYRIPYRLGKDYWIYRRYCREVCSRDATLVVGDSVVWGHYVARDETLSACLNKLAGQQRFVNLGVDGIEPAAMAGLIQYYGADIQAKDVILHCNLLWTADKRRDLQTSTERPITHPRLLPQFSPRISCYKETFSGRLGIVVQRNVSFLAWANHLRIAYFDNADLPHWTVENPYANPAGAVTLELPSPDEPPSPKPTAEPWTSQGIVPQAFPWVELDTSIQWRFFRRTVEILRRRGNRVFVLLGPFNEHMLKAESLQTYRTRKGEVETWLRENGIACYAPPALPSEHYADASHPLPAGYALLAEELLRSEDWGQSAVSR